MDRRLQRLQSRLAGLKDLVAGGIPPDLDQVLACEALVSELREEHESLQKELSIGSTPALRKLAKDFARLTPMALDVFRLANQACFDARFAIEAKNRDNLGPLELSTVSSIQESSTGTTATDSGSASGQSSVKQQQALVQTKYREEDDVYSQQLSKELKVIEDRAESVRALTENVAMLVAHQADDAAAVSQHTSSAREDVVAGLGELAEAKKKEAGKHTTRSTTVSAVIGGAVGLVGGPIGIAFGAAAGAAVGAAIGSSITSLSRRSIDREVRAFKDKFRVEVRADGSCFTYAEVYENERWSIGRKMWSSDHLLPTDYRNKWTLDDLGNPVKPDDPSPINSDAAPRPPVLNTEKKRSSPGAAPGQQSRPSNVGDGLEYEEGTSVNEDIEGNNSTFAGTWRWAQNSRWMPDMSDRNSDANGWQYAFSFAEGAVWYKEPGHTTFVRRRRWIRVQILDPQKAYHPERIALIVMARKRAEADARVHRTLQTTVTIPENSVSSQSLDQATRSLGQSVQASRAVLDELRNQGMQIHDAALDVAIAEDASIHAQRVARAVTMSGVIRNAFSSGPDATETVALRRDRDQARINRTSATTSSTIGEPLRDENGSTKVGWDHPVDALGKLADEQLQISEVIQKEVKIQNRQLDLLTEATTRGERRITRAKDMI